MSVVVAESLSKGYGGHDLFTDATFRVEAGDKVAIVGPNGAGKSTLLRILAGRETADDGTCQCDAPRIHWFDQHPDIPEGATVQSLLASRKPTPPAMQAEWDELETRIADPALYEAPGFEEVLQRYSHLEQEIKVATTPGSVHSPILDELGALAVDQKAASLSGGEKTRIFLARALGAVRAGDLVVLDEPTNHLDVDSIEWLENWINDFDGTVLLVAHDRVFLDNVATRIFEVSQNKITCFQGNYEDYVEARDEDIERARRDHAKAEEKVAGTKATLVQFRHQKRFDGQYASRMKALAKYQAALEQAPDPVLEKMGFGLAFGAVDKSSHEMLRFSDLRKSFGKPVLNGLDFEVRRDDRIGLVGANGAGKSTLLKILTGREKHDSGSIHVAPGVKGIFFSQEHDDLEPKRTLKDEVLDARPALEERDVKALLGRFRFNPDHDLGRSVSTLSGGERQRLMLLKCVLKPSNLLILDEPTNHLDLWARDVVVQALNAYHGTIIVVSHDRFLLDACTTTTAVLQQGMLHQYAGSFTQSRDQHKAPVDEKSSIVKCVVQKRFTDWTNKRKFAREEEIEFTEAAIRASPTLRNALSQGWLERIDS